mmetsp:Transcript_46297/g.83480  ORF Transcript_46297/g.83480 Transcript_46297/m.83480 type:complete len:935 (-) Transcript_46297:14-2818(-)
MAAVKKLGQFSRLIAKKEFEETHISEDSTSDDGSKDELAVTSNSESEDVKYSAEKLINDISEEEKEALQRYEEKFGEARDGSRPGYNRKSFPWYVAHPKGEEASKESLEAAARAVVAQQQERKAKLREVDADGEQFQICQRCSLPLGECCYEGQDGAHVHAECMAQIMLQEVQDKEAKLVHEQTEKKLESRLEHCIGWRTSSVPKNEMIAKQLGCSPAPKGLCSLVYDEVAKTVRIAATHEPTASVNLEYLLLALKVRRHACREPLFSLDPVDPQNIEKTPQKKRYEPDWLSGTSVGDIMFQADYFLKELALGEYTMPVVGMLSVFDWSEVQDAVRTWAGREWFVVKKAEVRLAEDKTLIPYVKMGVEAREQVMGKNGLEDAPITGANHPLKRFAEAFTRNFDLIAERKSVVFHLRELAKASVMAKFLVDSKAHVESTWYDLAEELVKSATPDAHQEIPQLWNMRGNSRIQLKDGKLLDSETGMYSSCHAIYGGVEFGLDRFELAQRHALPGAALQQQGLQSMSLGPTGRPMFMPQRFQLSQRGEMPQGVDLNLDKFGLSSIERFNGCLPPCSAAFDSPESRVILGRAFLRSLQHASWNMEDDKKKVLNGVFNPALCDRTEEGDMFTPPDPNMQYVTKLESLVKEEEALLEKRKLIFFDTSFVVGSAGPYFPRSWTSRHLIEGLTVERSLVKLQVDASFQKSLAEDILPAAAPEFSKVTEDGVTFRIYSIGSLEIRTTQAASGSEEVGAVFSRRAQTWKPAAGKNRREALETEKLVKAKFYVETVEASSEIASSLDKCHYFVVLETDKGNIILTEKLADGSTTWVVNPENIEDRNSLAKLLGTVEGKDEGATVEKLKISQISFNKASGKASSCEKKRYARAVLRLLMDKTISGRKYPGRAYPYPGDAAKSTRFARKRHTESPKPTEGGDESADI